MPGEPRQYVVDIELQTQEQFYALLERSEQLLLAGVPLPEKGARVRRGETLFGVRHAGRRLAFPSPLSGHVSRVNHELARWLAGKWSAGAAPSEEVAARLRAGLRSSVLVAPHTRERFRRLLDFIAPAGS